MDKSDCVEVTEIKIRIGNREIVLTPGEARTLRDVLNDLIGPGAAEPVYIPYPIQTQPLTSPWHEPIWVNPNTEPFPNKWHFTCGPLGQGGTLCINAN